VSLVKSSTAKAVALPEPKGGQRKAAIAVMALGPDFARDLFGILDPLEIQSVLQSAQSLQSVTADEVVEVLSEFLEEYDRRVMGVGHERLLKEAAIDVIGHDRVAELLGEEVEPDAARRQLKNVAESDPESFSQVIAKEHPQVIAIVLAILPPRVGAQVLIRLPATIKGDVVRRVATVRQIPAEIMQEVADVVGREFAMNQSSAVQIDGRDRAIALLKGTKGNEQNEIFEALKDTNEDLAAELRRAMFVFEDINRLLARDIQVLLREVDSRQLTLALKSASSELMEHFLSNMSSRAADMLREDIEAMPPQAVQAVIQAQEEIVETVLRLAEEGKLNPNPEDSL
jgi:flagellar motor switch protein FliG